MAKSNSGRQKSGKAIAGGRVTRIGKVTRAGALGRGDLREDLETLRQRKLSKAIRHPHGLVDPEEYHEIRGIIGESKLKFKIDWADFSKGRKYKPTWEPKSNVTEAAVLNWERRKPRSATEVYYEDTLLTPQLPVSPDLPTGGISSRADRLHKNPRYPPTPRDNSAILLGDRSRREIITRAVDSLDHDGEERTNQAPGSGPDPSILVKCGPSHNNPCNADAVRSISR
jgi:hypothetical protein